MRSEVCGVGDAVPRGVWRATSAPERHRGALVHVHSWSQWVSREGAGRVNPGEGALVRGGQFVVARRVLTAMWGLPELASVDSVFGCIDADNQASKRCFASAGFILDDRPDSDGMLRVTAARPAAA